MNTTPHNERRRDFLEVDVPKALLCTTGAMSVLYFLVLTFLFRIGNPFLFALLIAGEVYHVWQVLTFIYTTWDTSVLPTPRATYTPPVDVFITVAGEPVALVEETLTAALSMRYPSFTVHILNDGFVAKKENWRDIEALAAKTGVHCITRTIAGGAKAGNINNAMRLTRSPLVAIFDADHVPHEDFLTKTVGYFADPKVGFVQTPQFYKNYATNYVTRGSWEQQELFFGPICRGKNRHHAATMCGTNMLISRRAIEEVGGMCTQSIAEDFITGMFLHERGYTSIYVPEVLAEGLATEDLLTYSKQQFRWARGALDVIFRYNPLLRSGLSWPQKIEYLASASFYLSGIVVLFDLLLPLVFFYTGAVPVQISGMLLAAVFLPYMFLTLYTIERASNFTFTFRSLGFSMGAWTIHLRALISAITYKKASFQITQKSAVSGRFTELVVPHLCYIALGAVGFVVALLRSGWSASLLNNTAWVLINTAIFVPFVVAAFPRGAHETPEPRRKRRLPVSQEIRYGELPRN